MVAPMTPAFPTSRLRRNRAHPWLRRALQEHHLRPANLILPLFIREADAEREIPGLPGIFRLTTDEAVEATLHAEFVGISAVMLFPAMSPRSDDAAEAYNPNAIVPRAIRAIKQRTSGIGVITDVALDPYTIDGHDGITRNGFVDNDLTLPCLRKQALNYAMAGADIVAPSDMMDGRVGCIRAALDEQGFSSVGIMSYAAKFCSSLYGPFRSAVGVTQTTIDKSDYQLAITNGREALREIAQDIEEGADTIIIKPSLLYMDVIKEASTTFNVPLVAYMVSGEYAMVRSNPRIMMEACLGLRRAGAQLIIAYNAMEIAEMLSG
jgi:porphobilinogen synthase